MFLEVDDGVYVNLNNVFQVVWRSYENRGLWVFHPAAAAIKPPGPAAIAEHSAQSRQFPSREEGEIWLRKVMETAGIILHDPYDRRRRRSNPL